MDRRPSAPTISVALCTFNGGHHIEEQLASIARQDTLPHELVVSDDGSTDDTVEIVRRWADSAPFAVRILQHDHPAGVTQNFEWAMANTSGEVIVLSDQDDVWLPHRLRRTLEAIAGRQWAAVHSDALLINDQGDEIPGTLFGRLGLTSMERSGMASGCQFAAYLRRNLATGATIAVTRQLFEAARPFPASWLHDEWLAMIAAATDSLTTVHEPLIGYRLHSHNVVGMAKPTIRHRVGRVLGARGDRLSRLAVRAGDLSTRWTNLKLPAHVLTATERQTRATLIEAKAAFETSRGTLPGSRILRVPRVGASAIRGHYRKFASRGRLDILRDLVQPIR